MEIKILVPENREHDLNLFIKDCETKGFEVLNQGGGRMPNFSGYYATLKGDRWIEPFESREAEYREVLEKCKGTLENCQLEVCTETHYQVHHVLDEIETLLNKK